MARLDHREDMMDLARRALAHCINQTTDMTESIMTMPIEAYTDETTVSSREKQNILKLANCRSFVHRTSEPRKL